MKIPFVALDHVVLRTNDVARLRHFYIEVLGCTLEKVQDDIGLVQLRAGDALIDLVDVAGTIGRQGGVAPGPEGHNLDHFCLRVEPFDDDAIRKGLASHGVTLGDVVQRYGAHGEGPSCYLSDPDGNTVELKGPATSPPVGGH
ncbi:VOC family protein [Pandoraea sputorum]|uniref:Predicted enzyme related to lactoylglutathione lyase n=1 Tax=Pandoraea sputorum TaxID=93222 RepID=A0A239STN7_9BURK|nr:VOC family protein [Pandoraea sputorum]AJC14948.1 lactoylglutathione lyase [Pandoraea sputorum]SNU88767.1 Predicted enzyme related to lactoylglutathione lyase [Pandoraea sputorum]VVE43152.1 lactoylglutathione lyase [Pandoraea sputorum]VVE84821.1 lactoylglutathione lyase [Pandoraea sputorum]BET11831.1 VOC family protein [Pandoraea sputorum]